MKVKIRVEIDDKDFNPMIQQKVIEGADRTRLMCEWYMDKQKKILEISIERNSTWEYHKLLNAGMSSEPIHEVIFVNSGKK
jgi:hypothetical protein